MDVCEDDSKEGISKDKFESIYKEMEVSIDDFDGDAIKESVSSINNYRFPDEAKELVNELCESAMFYEIDICREISDKIIKMLDN